jgi:hypothetical protein
VLGLGGEAQTSPLREAWQAQDTHTHKQVRLYKELSFVLWYLTCGCGKEGWDDEGT